jgi:hypothetical protein
MSFPSERRAGWAIVAAILVATSAGCGGGSSSRAQPPPPPTRSWSMGFSPLPPRPSVPVILQGIDLFSTRAEIAAIHEELPWTDLLAGMSPDAILDRDKTGLVDYLRGKGLKLYFMEDLTDGLSRGEDAPQLRALGRSITDPAVQQVYRAYALAIERKYHPEFIGLGAETNLIRAAGPANLYAAVVQVANDAAADLRAAGRTAPIMISVQVETAWGGFTGGGYVGVEQDFQDFPFADVLGLSSYPYFVYVQPEDIPTNYYSRILNGRTLPVMIVEGGWTSASVGTIVSSPDKQARYIMRHAQLLDSVQASAVIQLQFADLDLSTFPPPLPANLPLFVNIGLTDPDFNPKPALAAWDSLHARRLVP